MATPTDYSVFYVVRHLSLLVSQPLGELSGGIVEQARADLIGLAYSARLIESYYRIW